MVNEVTNAKVQVAIPVKTAGPVNSNEGASKSAVVSKDAVSSAKPTHQEVANAMSKMQDFAQVVSRDLNFSLDEESGEVVIKVVDSKTDEIVRQIPSEEALRIARALEAGGSFLVETEA